jgi:hypothetical protein
MKREQYAKTDQVKSQVALVKLLREKALHDLSLMVISGSLS